MLVTRRFPLVVTLLAAAGLVPVAGAGRPAHACLEAYHARRILLGASEAGLVILELDWDRTAPRESVRWRGPARVGLLGPGQQLRDLRELGVSDVEIDPQQPDRMFEQQIRAGLAAARSYPGFLPADFPRHRSCDFQTRCGSVELRDDGSGRAALVVAAGGAPVTVPLTLSAHFLKRSQAVARSGKPEDLAADLRLVSLLSYSIAGREVLVVDLGIGDEAYSPGQPAVWPPCGCKEWPRCPPLATTFHHGTQFEVVVPLATPPLPATAAAPAPTARQRIRFDGVYATEPVCDDTAGWSLRFLRFFADGTVREVVGNQTPRGAFDLAGNDHFVVPAGKYQATGRRIALALQEDEAIDEAKAWKLAGRLESGGLRLTGGSRSGRQGMDLFRFVPVK